VYPEIAKNDLVDLSLAGFDWYIGGTVVFKMSRVVLEAVDEPKMPMGAR
jgi:hypothetical protein